MMMSRLLAAGALAVVVLASGCASVPMATSGQDAAAKSYNVKPNKANIYVYRNEQMGAAIDGLAPDNATGRTGLLANPMFRSVPAVGAAGVATPEPAFMNLTKVRLVGQAANRGTAASPNPECDYDGSAGTPRVSQYCH